MHTVRCSRSSSERGVFPGGLPRGVTAQGGCLPTGCLPRGCLSSGVFAQGGVCPGRLLHTLPLNIADSNNYCLMEH